MKIQIFHNLKNLQKNHIDIKINNHSVFFLSDKNCLIIENNLNSGFNMLTVKSKDSITFNDIKIDGDSMRELFYLNFLLDNKKKIQPGNTIDNESQIWCMPLILPLSSYFSFIQSTLPNGYIGKNLFDFYDFYFPESIILDNSYPSLIRDYFSYDDRFSILKKNTQQVWREKLKIPYCGVDLDVNKEKIFKEYTYNSDDILLKTIHQAGKDVYKTHYNKTDSWKYEFFIRKAEENEKSTWKERFVLDKKKWPILFSFLDSLETEDITSAFIAELPPKTFILPHCDSRDGQMGNSKDNDILYVPLSIPDNVYFKFSHFGLVNLARPSFINNRLYSHSVINDSENKRYILSLTLYKNNLKLLN